MAADVGQRFSGWACSDSPYNDHNPQDPSVQKMVLDHGSVSFGRFAAEPLSWERRSVFAHNSRQEEISKLTAPGLVAQKKAFFEEYYKKRHLRAHGAMHETQEMSEEADEDKTLDRISQEDQLPAVSDDPVASGRSSSFEPSTEVSSSDERKCQDSHEMGFLTFNPLFSQTAGFQNIQQEERYSSGQKHCHDRELPCAADTSSNNGHINEAFERKVLAPRCVVSNDNDENDIAGSRIVLPIASLQSEGLKMDRKKQGPRKTIAFVNRPVKRSKDLSTSVIHIPRVDLRMNSNRPSQDLKDPFHKRVEMKLRALSDRMSADKAAASSRSASYQPPDRAMASCRSSIQNSDKLATSRSSLCQNTGRIVAPSKSAGQASYRSPKDVHTDALPRGIFNKGSRASHVASGNSTATGKSSAKILVMPNSSQVSGKTSRTTQVTSKGVAVPTSVNNKSQNKRKQRSTTAALDENNPKRGHVRKSMPPSTRSSSDNSLPAAKAPKIANRTDMTKVTSTRAVSMAGSSKRNTRSNLTGGPSVTKNKPRATAMEDAASEISDWEVLSAASACGSDDRDDVVVVSGGGGDVLSDHFVLDPDSPDAGFPGGGSWSEPEAFRGMEDQRAVLDLLEGFDCISQESLDLDAGLSSVQLQEGGVDENRESSVLEAAAACGANLSAEVTQAEALQVDAEQENNSACSCGELDSVLQPAQHNEVGEHLDSDATTAPDASEVSDDSSVQLAEHGGTETSCIEDVVTADGIHGEQGEQEQGDDAYSASGCDESYGEPKDGSFPLVQNSGNGEGEKQVVVWWRLPFKLLPYCAWKVKPVWSFSIAAALLGLVVLGRRMYRMKHKAKGMPQIKIAFDDKRASQFANRAARLNEAFLIARRVPMLRTSSGAVLPWSMVQER
ncbi:hypothetical protein EJB05_21262 [Eragrostis curvula]|uniref:DUF6821 domain-containing protein n=1 Tax=Eragrostis curvula TaxID=38414 RepID=A0A5J9V2D4_9POAL|nr:hypothetical protein EJB05_21262 [Eragrostis curvula]